MRFRKGWIGAALVVAVAGVGGAAYAVIPDGNVIRACYKQNYGDLRVVDSASQCRTGETALEWGQQGAQGEPGPAGSAGPAGATGPVGPAGISEAYYEHRGIYGGGGSQAIPGDYQDRVVADLDLPAGAYTFMAAAKILDLDHDAYIDCYLRLNGVELTRTGTELEDDNNQVASVSLVGAATLASPGTVDVACRTIEDGVAVNTVDLVATRVGAVYGG